MGSGLAARAGVLRQWMERIRKATWEELRISAYVQVACLLHSLLAAVFMGREEKERIKRVEDSGLQAIHYSLSIKKDGEREQACAP